MTDEFVPEFCVRFGTAPSLEVDTSSKGAEASESSERLLSASLYCFG